MNSTATANKTKLLGFTYDAENNQTIALVETDEFSQWMFISGRVSLDVFNRGIAPYVKMLIEELR